MLAVSDLLLLCTQWAAAEHLHPLRVPASSHTRACCSAGWPTAVQERELQPDACRQLPKAPTFPSNQHIATWFIHSACCGMLQLQKLSSKMMPAYLVSHDNETIAPVDFAETRPGMLLGQVHELACLPEHPPMKAAQTENSDRHRQPNWPGVLPEHTLLSRLLSSDMSACGSILVRSAFSMQMHELSLP